MDRGGTLLHGRQHFRTITFLFYPSHHQGPGIFKDWTASQLADDFKNKQLKQFQSPTMRQLAEQLKKERMNHDICSTATLPYHRTRFWKKS